MKNPLLALPIAYHKGTKTGIMSLCSAHPIVIEAALRMALPTGQTVLIEATCNQVNQDGGYTGMTPAMFCAFVQSIADRAGFPFEKIILGGDHLGPNPWKHLPADEAMTKAEAMVAAYAAAGFSKLHLDASMGCRGEPNALNDEVTARRSARLAQVAEYHKQGSFNPVYIIGTEVPVPGGQMETEAPPITLPEAVGKTYEAHRHSFAQLKLDEAFSRVIGLVVQPGVEFGDQHIMDFKPQDSQNLSRTLANFPSIIYEAHSTDYQTPQNLSELVNQGFAILKVGPWLTYALREALYGLDAITDIIDYGRPKARLMLAMDKLMLDEPHHWQKYYRGSEAELRLLRHFSYSDRIRYYWPHKKAKKAVQQLQSRWEGKAVPESLLHQYLPHYGREVSDHSFHGLLMASVQSIMKHYAKAIQS